MSPRNQLALLPNWRYCMVEAGEKKPIGREWQQNPLTLEQVPETTSIGLMFGPVSSGVMAVDFDGQWAWDYWDEHIGITIPKTVSWSSCKPARAQLAFWVPAEYWEYLATKKISHTEKDESGKKPGIEFRWKGAQSVLPPSVNPDTRSPYIWLAAPSEVAVAEIPDALLAHWLERAAHINEVVEDLPAPQLDNVKDAKLQELIDVLAAVKATHPTLDYDNWIRVAWATASVIGPAAAKELLRGYWPEEKRGEYNKLLRGYNYGRSPKVGSLVFMVKENMKSKRPQINNKSKLF